MSIDRVKEELANNWIELLKNEHTEWDNALQRFKADEQAFDDYIYELLQHDLNNDLEDEGFFNIDWRKYPLITKHHEDVQEIAYSGFFEDIINPISFSYHALEDYLDRRYTTWDMFSTQQGDGLVFNDEVKYIADKQHITGYDIPDELQDMEITNEFKQEVHKLEDDLYKVIRAKCDEYYDLRTLIYEKIKTL